MGYYRDLSMEILGDRTRVAILRFLYRNKPNRFSQKQISDSIGVHPSSISRACSSLEKLNLIDRFSAGKTILYKLDEDSYITQKILVPLFANEKDFFRDLVTDILRSLDQDLINLIKEILLFGSILSGEDSPSSDIDLAIIIKAVHGSALRTRLTEDESITKIRHYFLSAAVALKLNLDLHVFVEGESSKEKGLSLEGVRGQGELIWGSGDEDIS